MQMQKIKKVASGAIGLFLTGATLMGPVMAADLSDFQSMAPSNTYVVVGASAITADVVGGINIGGKLAQSGIESATCSVSCEGGDTAQVANGVKIQTSSKKLYLDIATNANNPDSLRDVKNTLSENDLDLLAKQTITYADGTSTTMNQILNLTTNTIVKFSEDDADGNVDTPRLIMYNPASSKMYDLVLTFPTGLDTKDAEASTSAGPGIASQDITIMGKTFTVGVQNDISATKLVLFGGGEEKSLVAAGDPVTFELDGETHTIRMTSWTTESSVLKGVFDIDGVTYKKQANSAITINPTTNSQITIKEVSETKVPSVSGGAATEGAMAKIFIGSAKLTLENATEAKEGDDAISGANVVMTNSTTKINKITISYTPDEMVTSEAGEAYTDPIFGAFDFLFTGMTPDLKASTRDKIIIGKTGSKKIRISAPMYGGDTLNFNVYAVNGSHIYPDYDGKTLHLTENPTGVATNEYVLVSDGEASNLLRFSTMDKTNNIITLRDEASGSDIEVSYSGCSGSGTTETACEGDLYIGSSQYALTSISETAKTFTIDSYVGTGSIPSGRSVPLVTRNGANITFITTSPTTQNAMILLNEVDATESESYGEGVEMKINVTYDTTKEEVSTVDIVTNSPTLASIGDGDTNTGVSKYGTLVEDNTDGDIITMWYPDEMAYVNVYVMKHGATPSTSSDSANTASQTVTVAAPSLGNGIAKLDTSITDADKESKNLILVGGPAANNLVKDLAAEGKTPDMAYWMENLQGKYILQAVGDAFATGKTAIVVAGWEASETQAASLKLATEDVSGAGISCMDSTCSDFEYTPVTEEAEAEEVVE